MNLIEVKNLAFGYGQSEIFSGLNFNLHQNERAVIYGENGSGKSTFLSLIAGILKPKIGEICAKDGLKTAYLFQNSLDHFIAPNVLEDVAFSLLARKEDAKQAHEKAERILAEFKLSHLANRSIYTLSGGEKRLVAIAGVLVQDADLYLLDEPFNELDTNKTKLVLDTLNSLNSAFIIITHECCDMLEDAKIYRFADGKISTR